MEGRGGSILASSSSQSHRKEWRAVSESSYRNNGSEESERASLGQSDERTIYEVQEGTGPLDVDFCSITIDGIGGLSDELLQQRLQSVVRQREELQHVELELRAQAIARPHILEARSGFETQIKEHAAVTAELREQLQEREKYIIELEMNLEEKDRELRALKIDNEAAWAKEDLLREQNKELATFRRERDNSEAERAQHLKQIRDLQELIQDKETQLLALEEQSRVAQETMLYKEEQLREAHTWIARVQEMDVLQSTTAHSLQAELRERTEQFNQYWIGFQRQYAEMERLHLQTIQQLQLELVEARERGLAYKDGSRPTNESGVTDPLIVQQSKGLNHVNPAVTSTPNGNLTDGPQKMEKGSAVPVLQSPLMGIGAYIPPGQIATVHPFMAHPQSLTQSNSTVQMGNIQAMPTVSLHQHLQDPQDASQMPNQAICEPNIINANTGQQQRAQAIDPNNAMQPVQKESMDALNTNAQYGPTLQFYSREQNSVLENHKSTVVASKQTQEGEFVQQNSVSRQVQSTSTSTTSLNGSLESERNVISRAEIVQTKTKTKEAGILDERSLLACIVRAIPPGPDGRIKISTNLSNRLAKMLAPLHWHDYKKHYGKLDEFVARHPELFVIEGDLIRLREGAQQIVSATTAAAKVAADTGAPYSSHLPSVAVTPVAVTPVAQSNRQKRPPATHVTTNNNTSTNNSNNAAFDVIKGLADMAISNKARGSEELNGFSSESRQGFASGKQIGRSSGAPLASRR